MQSRGGALSDALTTRDVNEIADSPAGSVPQALQLGSAAEAGASPTGTPTATPTPTTVSYATVRSGKVDFEK